MWSAPFVCTIKTKQKNIVIYWLFSAEIVVKLLWKLYMVKSIIVLGLAICPRFRHHLHVEAFIIGGGDVIKLCVPL